MEHLFDHFFAWFEMPSVGLPAVFISSFISATLVPAGSEPILFGYITLNPHLFWIAIAVATVGNTLGGMVDWWMGLIARKKLKPMDEASSSRLKRWLKDWGPRLLLLSWLPGLGDPLCLAAGWMRLPWQSCLVYMFIGKLLRFITITWLLTLIPESFWHQLGHWLHLF